MIGLALAHEIRRRGLSTVALGYCNSACANAFLGGADRRLANDRSYVAFHGNYSYRIGRPLTRHFGQLSAFYGEMTNGRLNDQMIQLFLSKGERGFVGFYQRVTRNCEGTEAKRPRAVRRFQSRPWSSVFLRLSTTLRLANSEHYRIPKDANGLKAFLLA